jgi:hypothetical protein
VSPQSLARSAAPILLAALALASPASASTIGQAASGDFGCAANSIQVDPGYAATGAAKITSFNTATSPSTAGEQVDFLVLRQTTSFSHYTVVGKSGTETLGGTSAVQTFPVTPIAVQAGDVLGWFNITQHDGCEIFNRRGNVRSVESVSDPAVGDPVTISTIEVGVDLNLAATDFVGPVEGSGNTNPAPNFPVNAFGVSSSNGTLDYVGDNGAFFNGILLCINQVGNAATIVGIDNATGFVDRTMVQDNGASGDKLLNTLADPAKVSAKSLAKLEVCVDPDLTALARHPALAGNDIQIGSS